VERNKQNSLFKNPNVIEGILREPYQWRVRAALWNPYYIASNVRMIDEFSVISDRSIELSANY
jgi:hypothetical protein